MPVPCYASLISGLETFKTFNQVMVRLLREHFILLSCMFFFGGWVGGHGGGGDQEFKLTPSVPDTLHTSSRIS